ncbi:MAG TPA: ArgE/DapE family deacylase [Acidimicrobiia bacterium]|nr:ArgE/DapE family deacylase [Acidimicrobiia bacterium]
MIDADRARRTLEELIAIPSITGQEEEIQESLAGLLAAEGFEVDHFRGNIEALVADRRFPGMEVEHPTLPVVVARLDTGQPGPTILIDAHVDVVPPGDPDTWESPAFQPEFRNGNIYGRGACDMKGGLVSALEAMRSLKAEPAGLVGQALLALVPGEEDGGSGTFAVIKEGYTADLCLIPEPTGLDIVVAHGGAITFTLEVAGKAAHASMRREGVSALDNLSYLVEALKVDERLRNEAETDPRMAAIGLPYPTIIGQVEGGNWASSVMDKVVAHGRYGVTVGQDAAAAAADLRAAISLACDAHPFLREHPVDVSIWGGRFDSASVPSDHQLPRGIATAHRSITGSSPNCVGAPYGADMRLFVQEAGIPTVMYGPGSVRHAHAANEHVSLDEVVVCAEVLAEWMRQTLVP